MALNLKSPYVTAKPPDHVAYWTGGHPYRADGQPLEAFSTPDASRTVVLPSLPPAVMFSGKPKDPYRDYRHKVRAYVLALRQEVLKIGSVGNSSEREQWLRIVRSCMPTRRLLGTRRPTLR